MDANKQTETSSISMANAQVANLYLPTITQQQIDIINIAADCLLAGEKSTFSARDSLEKAENGQLASLAGALQDYPGNVTEAVWDSFLKVTVAKRLKDSPSKDTLTNRLKRATMGLTLAKEDPSFAPVHPCNLKKYAEWVGKKLQVAIDPATDQPRLKSIAKSEKPKKLAKDTFYWLLGCEGEGLDYKAIASGKNTIICGPTSVFEDVRKHAKVGAGTWKTMLCFTAPKPVLLDLAEEENIGEEEANETTDSVVIVSADAPHAEEVAA